MADWPPQAAAAASRRTLAATSRCTSPTLCGIAAGLQHTSVTFFFMGRVPFVFQDYTETEGLYNVERQAAYTRGSVFLYSLGTWHRGTPVEPHGVR